VTALVSSALQQGTATRAGRNVPGGPSVADVHRPVLPSNASRIAARADRLAGVTEPCSVSYSQGCGATPLASTNVVIRRTVPACTLVALVVAL
jgi:hypothetical protein